MTEFRPALFLVHDGVLGSGADAADVNGPADSADGAVDCIRAFNARNYLVCIINNQPDIAMGLRTEDELRQAHQRLTEALSLEGAKIDGWFFCPFHPDASVSFYRKDSFDRLPRPGMILQAMAELPIRKEASFLIGPNEDSLQAARHAGVGGFLYKGGNLAVFAEWALADFESGAR